MNLSEKILSLKRERDQRILLTSQLESIKGNTLVHPRSVAESERFFRHVLANIPVDLVVFDSNHKYLYISPTAVMDEGIRNWMIGKDDFEYLKNRNKPIESMELLGVLNEYLD